MDFTRVRRSIPRPFVISLTPLPFLVSSSTSVRIFTFHVTKSRSIDLSSPVNSLLSISRLIDSSHLPTFRRGDRGQPSSEPSQSLTLRLKTYSFSHQGQDLLKCKSSLLFHMCLLITNSRTRLWSGVPKLV